MVCRSVSHTLVIVVEMGLDSLIAQTEVLRLHGRSKGADCFAGCTPKPGHHIEGESKGCKGQEETRHAGAGSLNNLTHLVVLVFVVRETYPSDEVGSHQGEDDNPQAEEHFAVHQMPAVGEICHAEELQREGYFQQAETNLDAVHPVTALGHTLEPGGEQGEECEGECQSQGKSEHTDGGGK